MRITSNLHSKRSLYPNLFAQNLVIQKFLQAAVKFLANYYGLIIASMGAVIVLMETIEHYSLKSFYYSEVFLLLLLLLITAFLTNRLVAALRDRGQIVQTLRIKHAMSLRLDAGLDLLEVSRRLVQQISSIFSLDGVQLYLFDRNKSWFVPAGSKTLDPMNETPAVSLCQSGFDPFPCRRCMERAPHQLRSMWLCQHNTGIVPPVGKDWYCLPLISGSHPVGIMQLQVTPKDFSDAQIELLENISPEMSGSLLAAMEKGEREENLLTEKIRTVQLDIARDLHDTIGQNISYLRMRLEHLASSDPDSKNAAEIQQMCAVANESYDLVRGTLAMLQSSNFGDLQALFSRYAGQIAERADFEIDFNSQGSQKALTPYQIRQIFYIFREALSNIEKHAGASQVRVETQWDKENLTLLISDNGRGFDPAHMQNSTHYGLRFMRERTEQMNGSLSVLSTACSGTNIVVHVPYLTNSFTDHTRAN